jgi:hypothetical protein
MYCGQTTAPMLVVPSEPINADVSLALAAVTTCAGEMSIEGGAVVLLVTTLGLQAIAEKGVASRCIDDLTGRPGLGASIVMHPGHAHPRPVLEEFDVLDLAALDDLGALGRGTPDQYLVEFGASDLVRHGLGFVPGVGELKFLAPAIRRRNELRAPFLHADGTNFFGNAESFQQRHISGQQGFADVEPRVAGLFQHDDPVALLGQEDGRRGAGRAAADDQYVVSCRRREGVGHHEVFFIFPCWVDPGDHRRSLTCRQTAVQRL